jgi:hypothetical protein
MSQDEQAAVNALRRAKATQEDRAELVRERRPQVRQYETQIFVLSTQ